MMSDQKIQIELGRSLTFLLKAQQLIKEEINSIVDDELSAEELFVGEIETPPLLVLQEVVEEVVADLQAAINQYKECAP